MDKKYYDKVIRKLKILLFVAIGVFLVIGLLLLIAGISAGSLDNMVAGISVLALWAFLTVFFIIADAYGSGFVYLDEEALVYRAIFGKEKRYAIQEVEDIAYKHESVIGGSVIVLLKNGKVMVAKSVVRGWEIVKTVRKSVPTGSASKPLDVLKSEYLQSKKKRAYSIGAIIFFCCALVVGLAMAIICTEGKEVDFFDKQDWVYFSIFMTIFAISLVAILVAMPSLFLSINAVQASAWAWRRGIIFQDTLALSNAQEIYVNNAVEARLSFEKHMENDEEKATLCLETYILRKGEMIKEVFYHKDKKAIRVWMDIEQDENARSITHLVKKEEVFQL